MLPDIVFSDQARDFQARARRVADESVRPLAAKHDRLQRLDREAIRAAAEAGLFRILVPKEYGGAGAGTLALCLAAEELAKADAGFAVVFGADALGTLPLLLAGTPEQRRRWLPALARGEALAAFSISEKVAGSDLGAVATTAEKRGGGYVLRGEKKWITNGGEADVYTVFCVTDSTSPTRRLSAFLVEKGTPGFRVGKVEDKMGIRSAPVAELHFDGVRVPAENLLGGLEGGGYNLALEALDRARPCAAAQAVGVAQGALDLALVYADRRRQLGKPIARFQMVQGMLADMATRIEAARWLAYAAAARVDAGGESPRKLVAMSKCFATDAALQVVTDAVQIFGGYGFMEDYPIARHFRDAKIFQILEGTNQMQRLAIASSLIKELEGLAHLEEYIPREEQRSYQEDEAPGEP